MKIKPGAVLMGLHPKMRMVLSVAEEVWQEHGQELVVTAGLDGEHAAGSAHYYGCAVDLRTRYFDKNAVGSVIAKLKKRLPMTYYYVVDEGDHIHVHYRHPDWA